MDYRVISIGTLAAHPLWEERGEVRTGHATTTLVTAGDMHLLVDPSLPPTALLARLGERTPIRASDITHVFLTSADTLHRRGLAAFGSAEWLAGERELTETVAGFERQLAESGDDAELSGALRDELAILRRCRPAPDRLHDGVDLFPLPGVTPGCCGLLLSLPQSTVLIAGDAVATR
ncbi:MAG: MBL fold metallo-hydrolase, partial [Acidobacteria bacterium]|nr:MBL fold metallo-hydrolase [Acidobacteriota bacterium]